MKKLLILLSVMLIIIDQGIKYIVVSNLNVLDSVNIIPNFLNITYVTNSGGAFSILSGSRYFFIILGIIAIIYLIKYIMSDSNITKVDLIAYSLVISGIIGNLIDRIIYGYVIDYIHFYISSYSFAIFNFADMCIVIGAIIIIVLIDLMMNKMILDKVKTMNLINEAITRTYKELFSRLVPVIIITLVFCFSGWTNLSSFGMVMFWGLILIAIYNIVVTKTLLKLKESK